MEVNNHIIFILINKDAQKKKMGQVGNILLHPDHVGMERYLQMGPVLQVGAQAKAVYPEVEPGDIAIFHHTIEDMDERVVETLDNGDEVRFLDAASHNIRDKNIELLGVIKATGLVATKYWTFLSPSITKIRKRVSSQILERLDQRAKASEIKMFGLSTAAVPDKPDEDIWDEEEWLRDQIDKLQAQVKLLSNSLKLTVYPDHPDKEYDRRYEIIKAQQEMIYESGRITNELSRQRYGIGEVIAINSTGAPKGISNPDAPGQKVIVRLPAYPLELFDEGSQRTYYMTAVRPDHIVAEVVE